ncbi:unnamed protein product [Spodoptera exigua]|nr:unnamed protein product [Spodoptera exigua]
MSKPLCLSEIELLVNQQNTGDSESSTYFMNLGNLHRVDFYSSGSLISPEDLGLISSGLNNQDDFTEDSFDQSISMLHAAEDQGISSEDYVTNTSSDHNISILHATEDLGFASESKQVLSPIFQNLSDNSDDDPDWVLVISQRRRSFCPLRSQVEEHLDFDESIRSLSVQDLKRNRNLFLKPRRILPFLDDEDSDSDDNVLGLLSNLWQVSTVRVIIISDGCGHQNQNRILSSALSDLAQRRKICIEQLYLEKGHTMMEVDSVQSTIEQYIKPPIFAPSDYITRIKQARPQKPYDVKSIHYDFFR